MAEEQDIKQETVEETENTTNVEAPTVEKLKKLWLMLLKC